MRVLVSGSGGFIGRAVMDAIASLEPGWTTVPWSRQEFGDLLNADARWTALNSQRPDIVLHLAWLATGTPHYEQDPSNAAWGAATAGFGREAVEVGAAFVGLGSMIEDVPTVRTPYAAAKRAAADEVLALSAQQRGRPIAWLRPSWVFDFAQQRPRLLREYVDAVSSKGSFEPREPKATRDFVHVRDVATAAVTVMRRGMSGEVDVRAGFDLTIDEFLAAFGAWSSGASAPSVSPAAPWRFGYGRPARSALVLEEHGWQPVESARYLGVDMATGEHREASLAPREDGLRER